MNYTKLKREIELEIQKENEYKINSDYLEQLRELNIEVLK